LAVLVESSTNVTIGGWQHGNTFAHFNGGVYALSSSGVKVLYNDFRDVHADWADLSRGQFVQFDKVSGANNQVSRQHRRQRRRQQPRRPNQYIQVERDGDVSDRHRGKLL
jgi:hypothetical protein